MPVQLVFNGENAQQAVQEVFAYLGSFQAHLNVAVNGPIAAATVEAPKVEAPKEAAPAAKGKAKTAAKAAPVESKHTLQDVIDASKKLAEDSKEAGKEEHADVMKRLTALNAKHAVAKVRELPTEKLDLYMADLQSEFAAEIAAGAEEAESDTASMFD
jgi:hypothetical protein